jgi:hypothetical protein
MNSQNDKDGSPHIRAAVIAGIFAVVAACIGGVFLVIVAFINNGFIFAGAGNQNPYPTTAPISTQIISIPTQSSSNENGGTLTSCSAFQNGETRKVSSGTFVIGDIIIDGTSQYDSGGTSEGTVAYFEKESTVIAQWGAGCYIGSKNLANDIIQGEFQHGCGSKCASVRFVVVQSDGQQQIQYFNK